MTSPIPPVPHAAPSWCRVLVVDHGIGLWGAQVYLLRLAPLLAARGVEQVLAAPADSQLARVWRERGYAHVPIAVAPDRALRGARPIETPVRVAREAARNVRGARQVARLARSVGADVLHANSHGWSYTEVVAAGRLARRPSVVHLHLELERSPLGRLWGRAMLGADAIVAVSLAVMATLPGRAGVRTRVVPCGVDPAEFSPGPADPAVRAELAADPSAPVVLVLARLEERKGIEDVIRAVAALPSPLERTALAIAGASSDPPDPGYEARLRGLGRDLLGDRVRFLGRHPDAPRLIRAADAVALASQSEGFGLCVLEAQACGVPPVAYPAGGVAELISHGVDGLRAVQGDVEDLSRQLALVLGDRALADRLGAQARQRVITERTLERQADAQVEVLRTVLLGSTQREGRHPGGPAGDGAAHPGRRDARATDEALH